MTSVMSASEVRALVEKLTQEIHRDIVGQERLIERLLVALFSDGHILIEGPPGLAKTRTLTVLASLVSGNLARVQFTPDLLPSDLIGSEIYRPERGEFIIRKGPIFAHIVLADEINRAPAKVQSALLQAMQERHVTIADQTFPLPSPFMVLATQNPIDQEGTYRLPEAQLDRFLFKVIVPYPTAQEEAAILALASASQAQASKRDAILLLDTVLAIRSVTEKVFCDPLIDRYIVTLVQATRDPSSFGFKGLVDWGASPRASIALKRTAQSLALMRGKDHVTPDEVQVLAPDVLRHRLQLSFEGESTGMSVEQLIQELIKKVPRP
jgi:MoxR-like ATPase